MSPRPIPPHGSQGRYKGTASGSRPPCRCRACVTAASRAGQIRTLARLAGRPRRIDAAPVVAHLQVCLDSGMSQCLIARQADVDQSTISRLLRRPNPQCMREQGERLLAVRPGDFSAAGLRPAIGTIRRIRGLYAVGHGPRKVGDLMGVAENRIIDTARGIFTQVTLKTAVGVQEAVATLQYQVGTDERARSRALREGWHPLGAWDNIDDPNCQPDVPTAVLNVRQRAELRREEIIHFAWHGDTPEQIRARLNNEVSISTVRQIVNEWRTNTKRQRKPATATDQPTPETALAA